jgi:amino acid permease
LVAVSSPIGPTFPQVNPCLFEGLKGWAESGPKSLPPGSPLSCVKGGCGDGVVGIDAGGGTIGWNYWFNWATTVVGGACLASSLVGDGNTYVWLVNTSGLAGFITWMGIAWSHLKFRRAFPAQGHDVSELPFRSRLYSAGSVIALAMCAVAVFGQGRDALFGEHGFTALISNSSACRCS